MSNYDALEKEYKAELNKVNEKITKIEQTIADAEADLQSYPSKKNEALVNQNINSYMELTIEEKAKQEFIDSSRELLNTYIDKKNNYDSSSKGAEFGRKVSEIQKRTTTDFYKNFKKRLDSLSELFEQYQKEVDEGTELLKKYNDHVERCIPDAVMSYDIAIRTGLNNRLNYICEIVSNKVNDR